MTTRSRLKYGILIILVVICGLASRSSWATVLPRLVQTYAGDTLWALALFLGLAFLFPTASTLRIALVTLALSFGVELSQIYQAEWINAVRSTRIGGLILGFGFKGSDLICYTLGCSLGVLGERLSKKQACAGKSEEGDSNE
jgi:hypothetical protein